MKDRHLLKASKKRSSKIAEYLSWLYFTEHGFVVTKNSLLLAFFEVTPYGDYYDGEVDEQAASSINRFAMGLPDGMTLWYEYQKNLPEEPLYKGYVDLFQNPYDRRLEELRTKDFKEATRTYQARRILTLCFSPSISKAGITDESYQDFEKTITEMKGRFDYARIAVNRMDRREICNYLHSIISSKKHDIAVPSGAAMALSDTLWDDDIDKTLVPMRLGDDLISIIAVDDFPETETSSEMLNEITKVDGSIRWVTRWIAKSPEEAKKIIDTRRRRYLSRKISVRDYAARALFNSDIELENKSEISKSEECDIAMEMNGNIAGYGYYTGIFVVTARTEKEIKRVSQKLSQVLAKHHFVYREETLNLFGAWIGSLPGNVEANPRRQFISTGNLSDVISLSKPYTGLAENRFLKDISGCGVPHAFGLLPTGDIYNLNLNGNGDLGHTFVVGPTGAGKSILLSFLAASWGKYPDSRVIFFDKGLTSASLVNGNHGIIMNPGKDDTTFLPLRNAAQDQLQIERCMRFLESIADVQRISLSASDKEHMLETLKLIAPGHETLSIFRAMLAAKDHDSDMVIALKNYCEGGSFGGLFDSDSDSLDIEAWPSMVTFEMGALMDLKEPAIVPALTYIFGILMRLFEDRKPTLLIFDEAWIFMKDDFMRNYLIECLKTLRKYNVFVVLATQEVSDYSGLMESILTNCHTRILLPNENAMTGPMSEIYKGIGLTETDIHAISDGRQMRAKRDYYVMQPEGKAVVNFCLSDEQLKLIGGR